MILSKTNYVSILLWCIFVYISIYYIYHQLYINESNSNSNTNTNTNIISKYISEYMTNSNSNTNINLESKYVQMHINTHYNTNIYNIYEYINNKRSYVDSGIIGSSIGKTSGDISDISSNSGGGRHLLQERIGKLDLEYIYIHTILCTEYLYYYIYTITLTNNHSLYCTIEDDDYQAMRGMIIINKNRDRDMVMDRVMDRYGGDSVNHGEGEKNPNQDSQEHNRRHYLRGNTQEHSQEHNRDDMSGSEGDGENRDIGDIIDIGSRNRADGSSGGNIKGKQIDGDSNNNSNNPSNSNSNNNGNNNGSSNGSNSNGNSNGNKRMDDDFHFIIPSNPIPDPDPNSMSNPNGRLRGNTNTNANTNTNTNSGEYWRSRPPPPEGDLEELVFFNRHITQPKHDKSSFDRAFPIPIPVEPVGSVAFDRAFPIPIPVEPVGSVEPDIPNTIHTPITPPTTPITPITPIFIIPIEIEEKIEKPPGLPREWTDS